MTGEPSQLRLLRAPAIDGPFDDEGVVPTPTIEGTLALDLPELEQSRPYLPLRLVPPAMAPVTETAATPPPIGPWATRVTQAIAEILAGARVAAQLYDHASLEVLALLERSAGRLDHTRRGSTPPKVQPIVMSVHLSELSTGVVEACAVVNTGPRRRALALRFEAVGDRWRCTALQVG